MKDQSLLLSFISGFIILFAGIAANFGAIEFIGAVIMLMVYLAEREQ